MTKDACPNCGDRTFVSDETFALNPERSAWVNTCKACGTISVHHEALKENLPATANEQATIAVAQARINKAKRDFEKEIANSQQLADIREDERFKKFSRDNPNYEKNVIRNLTSKLTAEMRFNGIWQ